MLGTEQWKETFVESLRRKPHVRAACITAGINHQSPYYQRQVDPEFARQWDAAVAEARRGEAAKAYALSEGERYEALPAAVASAVDNALVASTWGTVTPGKSVYIIRESWRGLCKVGCTADVKNRLASIQSAMPQQCAVVALFRSNRGRALESFIHDQFAIKRHRGEWFELSAADIDHVERVHRVFCESDGQPVDCWRGE